MKRSHVAAGFVLAAAIYEALACDHERRFHSWTHGCDWPDCPCTRFTAAHSDAR